MDFKARAVEMSPQEGVQVQQVADGLRIHPFMLSRWRKEYREGKIVRDRRRRESFGVRSKTCIARLRMVP